MKNQTKIKFTFCSLILFALLMLGFSWHNQHKVDSYKAEMEVYKNCFEAKQNDCGEMPVLR